MQKKETKPTDKTTISKIKDWRFIWHCLAAVAVMFFVLVIRLAVLTTTPAMPGVSFFGSPSFQIALEKEGEKVYEYTDAQELEVLFDRLSPQTPISSGFVNLSMQDAVVYFQMLYELNDNPEAQATVGENLENMNNRVAPAEKTNLTSPLYRKEDLMEWAKEGARYESKTILFINYIDPEGNLYQSFEEVNPQNLVEMENIEAILMTSDSFLDEIDLIDEKFPPIGFVDIMDFANNHLQDVSRLVQQLAKVLEYPLIRGDALNIQEPDSNVGYNIQYSGTKNEYSNMAAQEFSNSEWTAVIQLNQDGTYRIGSGPYFQDLHSYFSSSDKRIYNLVPRTARLAVDTNFPQQDYISAAYEIFGTAKFRFWTSIGGVIVFAFLWILAVYCYLQDVKPSVNKLVRRIEYLLPIELVLAILFLFFFMLFKISVLMNPTLEKFMVSPQSYKSVESNFVLFAFSLTAIPFSIVVVQILTILVRKFQMGAITETSLINRGWVEVKNFFSYFFNRGWDGFRYSMSVSFLFLIGVMLLGLLAQGYKGFFTLSVIILAVFTFMAIRALGEYLWLIEATNNIVNGRPSKDIKINDYHGLNKRMAQELVAVDDSIKKATEDRVKNERMQTELITNISHDIRTPLTSIINYVSLLKQADIDPSSANEYISIIDSKANRLNDLMNSLIDATRASNGALHLDMIELSFNEVIEQIIAEYVGTWEERDLSLVTSLPKEDLFIRADGFHLSRVLDNLLNNARKYAMPGTRVYLSLREVDGECCFELKNTSSQQLNLQPEELMERFTRGDKSRTTEGSGLGLSIARNTIHLMQGRFDIVIDGDLFKSFVTFKSLT